MGSEFSEIKKFLTLSLQPQVQSDSSAVQNNCEQNINDNYFIENSIEQIEPSSFTSGEIQEVTEFLQTEAESAVQETEIKEANDALESLGAQQAAETLKAADLYCKHIDKIIENYYPNKTLDELSDSDIQKAIMLDNISKNTASTNQVIEKYFETEGFIDDGVNWFKDLVDIGISKNDILQYLEKETLKNDILKATLTNGVIKIVENTVGLSDEELLTQGLISKDKALIFNQDFRENEEYSFEQIYSLLTGTEYNEEKIAELSDITPVYQEAISKYSATENLENIFESFDSPTQIVKYYQQTLGCTKEEAILAFNEYYANNLPKLNNNEGFIGPYGNCLSFALSDDGKTMIEQYSLPKEQYEMMYYQGVLFGEYDEKTGIYTLEHSVEVLDSSLELNTPYLDNSIFKTLNQDINSQNIISNEAIKDFNSSEISKEYGTFEEVVNRYNELSKEVYGENELEEKFLQYQKSMDNYASNFANKLSLAGIALSFIVNPAFGIVALVGGFSDNIIDLFNLASNEKDGEIGAWTKQFAKEATAVAIGYGIGAYASGLGDDMCAFVLKKGMKNKNISADNLFKLGKAAGTATEAVVDFGLSYPADVLYEAMLTGKFNWEGNLFGNILGSAMDIKGGIGAYRAIKGNNKNFEYTFKDGSHLSYSKENGIKLTTLNEQTSSAAKPAKIKTTAENQERTLDELNEMQEIFEGQEGAISKTGVASDLEYSPNKALETQAMELKNRLAEIPELQKFSETYLNEITGEAYALAKYMEMLETPDGIENLKTIFNNPKAQSLFDMDLDFIISIPEIASMPKAKVDTLLKLSDSPYFAEIFKSSFFKTKVLNDIPTNEKELSKFIELFNMENFAKNKMTMDTALQLSKLDDSLFDLAKKHIENNAYNFKIEKVLTTDKIPSELKQKLLILEDAKLIKSAYNMITSLTGNLKLNSAVLSDVDLLYQAHIKGLSLSEAFAPKFSSLDECVKNSKIGDVGEVNGKLHIKKADGTLEELKISAETYLKLFPPIDRYTMRQGGVGDCYLVGGSYSIFANPATRANILKCFSEDENGNITFAFDNSKMSLTVGKNGEGLEKFRFNSYLDFPNDDMAQGYNKTINLNEHPTGSTVQGSLGFQMLEIAFGMDALQAFIDNRFNLPMTDMQKTLLKNPAGGAIAYLKNLFEQYPEDSDPKEVFEQNIQHTVTVRGNGGTFETFFNYIGIKSTDYKPRDLTFDDLMKKSEFGPITAASKKDIKNTKLNIKPGHAHIIKPFIDENGVEKVIVIDPHDTQVQKTIEYKELFEYFSELTIVEN